MENSTNNSFFSSILNLYREAVKKLPVLKYSWGIIVIICILTLITYLRIGNPKALFKGSIYVIGIMFLIFIFSLVAKTNDKVIRYPLYILVYSIILTLTAFVIGFAIHNLTNYKFEVYYKLFGYPPNKDSTSESPTTETKANDSSTLIEPQPINPPKDTNRIDSNLQVNHNIKSIAKLNNAKVPEGSANAESFFNQGEKLAIADDFKGAIDKFTTAINIKPNYAKAYNARGKVKRLQEDFTGAIADYTQAIKIEPKRATYYCNRGVARRYGGDCDGAQSDINFAIQLDPRDGNNYFQRGVTKRNCFQDNSGGCNDILIGCNLGDNNACVFYNANCK